MLAGRSGLDQPAFFNQLAKDPHRLVACQIGSLPRSNSFTANSVPIVH
jgi:hypothetical protein